MRVLEAPHSAAIADLVCSPELGGKVVNEYPMHGWESHLSLDDNGVFFGIFGKPTPRARCRATQLRKSGGLRTSRHPNSLSRRNWHRLRTPPKRTVRFRPITPSVSQRDKVAPSLLVCAFFSGADVQGRTHMCHLRAHFQPPLLLVNFNTTMINDVPLLKALVHAWVWQRQRTLLFCDLEPWL